MILERTSERNEMTLEIQDRKKENRKRVGVFVYISIIAHFYILLVSSYILDPHIYSLFFNPEKDKQILIENIFVDTHTVSEKVPDKGLASQNPNIDSAPKTGPEKVYEYINESGGGKQVSEEQASSPALDKSPDGWQPAGNEGAVSGQPAPQVSKVVDEQKYSDYHTSYSDKKDIPDVIMDTRGDISISTLPVENAEYLSNIRKKVVDSWMVFFPVFQYYQGLLKKGDVMVLFTIDTEGNIKEAKIVESFGYKIADEAALNAVLFAGNFGPLPDGLDEDGALVIRFNFAY